MMATKIPPKNYDNKLSRRKQDLNQIAKNESDIAALQALPVLPAPAAGDVGKVVKVGSDGYELASDAGAKLVTATVTADGQGNLSCDKTYAELSASIANGDIVELVYNNQTFVYSGTDYPGIHFVLAKNDSNGHNVITAWTISSSDVITFNIEGMNSELPSYSSADANKVLTVDSTGALEFIGISSDIVVIRCTWNESSQINLPNGMTQNDLVALYKAGKIPILDCTSTTESSVLRLIMYMYRTTQSSGKMAIEFSSFYYYSGVKIRSASAKDENTYNYLTIESH